MLYSGVFSQAAATVDKLGSALGGLLSVPNAVGIGAVVISMILETIGHSIVKQTMGNVVMFLS